jgi:hypothetical protein
MRMIRNRPFDILQSARVPDFAVGDILDTPGKSPAGLVLAGHGPGYVPDGVSPAPATEDSIIAHRQTAKPGDLMSIASVAVLDAGIRLNEKTLVAEHMVAVLSPSNDTEDKSGLMPHQAPIATSDLAPIPVHALPFAHLINADLTALLARDHLALPHNGSESPANAGASGGGDPSGQLWFGGAGDGIGNPDGSSDFRVEHADSDGLTDDQIIQQQQSAGGIYQSIGLDTSAGLSISIDESFVLHITNINTGVDLTSTVVASKADFDTVNAIAVDAVHNVIYMDLDGYDFVGDGGDIIKITYNQTTGAIQNPYLWNDTTMTGSVNLHDVLVDSQSSGNKFADARAFYLTHDGSTLYYVDDDDNFSIGPAPDAWRVATNGVYKVSTTGDVGDGNAPTPVMLSVQSQFPTNDSNGYITGITVDEARGIIYFTTDSSAFNTNQWIIPPSSAIP